MTSIIDRVLSFGAGKYETETRSLEAQVSSMAGAMARLSDAGLLERSRALRSRAEAGEPLRSLEAEALALARESCKRGASMRPYDCQVAGAHALVSGKVAEMATGEGKTVVALMAAYVLSLPGDGVHVVTVNDYLAGRDAGLCARALAPLGVSVGCVQAGAMGPGAREAAYRADVTYGTVAAFGFDYLRDHMAADASARAQRGHAAAVVDEADSVLIDEARTPLIISGAPQPPDPLAPAFAAAVGALVPDMVEVDLKERSVMASDRALDAVEAAVGLPVYGPDAARTAGLFLQALRARFLFERDRDYVVEGGEVKIVDSFTGRVMEGRRFSEGLHQAIEAKEGVEAKGEDPALAQVSVQNYFRLYGHLCGMSGTAATCGPELLEVYGLDVAKVRPNRPSQRVDLPDEVHLTAEARFEAVAAEAKERSAKGQPVLIGTGSVEESEELSRRLAAKGVAHAVLNAKNHAAEARIVAQAGRPGAVTVSTAMAGRGTDIKLGGDAELVAEDALAALGEAPEALKESVRQKAAEACAKAGEVARAAGGLCVIGCGRGESRRVDDQLRGRSGRQGDPGETKFCLSLDDSLFARFGADALPSMRKAVESAGGVVAAGALDSAVSKVQRHVEDIASGQRRSTLDYDDVLDAQRRAVYRLRDSVLDGEGPLLDKEALCADTARDLCRDRGAEEASEALRQITGKACDLPGRGTEEACRRELSIRAQAGLDALGERVAPMLLKRAALSALDNRWQVHLQELAYLKGGIGLRGLAQRDPLSEYRQEASWAFDAMLAAVRSDVLSLVCRTQAHRPVAA